MKKEKLKLEYIFYILMAILIGLFLYWLFHDDKGTQWNVFFRKTSDYFADYINVLRYSAWHDPYFNALNGPSEKGYFPLTYLIFYWLAKAVNFAEYRDDGVDVGMWTTNLTIAGTYAVLTSGNRKKSVSSKVKGEARERLVKLVEQTAGEYGVILRTNAAEASDEAVLLELEVLSERYETMAEAAAHKNCYTLVYREEAGWLRHIRDLRKDDLEEIVTDDRGMFEDICSACRIHKRALTTGGSVPVPVDDVMTADGIRIRYYKDPALSLGALYSVRSELKNALSERVWLKSGAYLVIQPTEALTVVDVNTGKNVAKKEMQENFLRVNKEAAEEIARQLRLRNLSGMVLVDFINLTSKSAEEELLKTFRAALQKDPVPAQLIDMTALGLVEVTRKKIKRPLHEIFPDGLGF